MKKLVFVLFLFLVDAININSLFAQTPSLEETLQWIKEKIEAYPSNNYEQIKFEWDESYKITIIKIDRDFDETLTKRDEDTKCPGYGYAENKYASFTRLFSFDLCNLDPNKILINPDNTVDNVRLYCKYDSKLVNYFESYDWHFYLYCSGDGGEIHKERINRPLEKQHFANINITYSEPDLFERMKTAWKNAIAKCPKQQTNEKF